MAKHSVLKDATFYLSGRWEVPYMKLDGRLFELTTGKEIEASPELIQRTIAQATEVTLEEALERTKELKLSTSKTTKTAVLDWLRAIRRKAKKS